MKSLNLNAIVVPEIGLIIFIVGLLLLIYGYKQSKKEYGFDNIPIINPALKEIIGVFFLIFGFVQILPFFGNY
jgi:vacuolar-type H+-ATPase subunit I/STV1